ncbi:MAG: TIGR01620 family protein [Amphritea sp.]|jgi:putative membrane protein|nr:TIGR01620 family protein [Amphritea sp.]
MNKNPQHNETAERRTGHQFSVDNDDAEGQAEASANEPRQAKTFIPENEERLSAAPETITTGERLPRVSEYSSIQLETLPLKGLKNFVKLLSVLVIVIIGWDIYDVFQSALAIHWSVACAFVLLITLVAGMGGRLAWRYFGDRENLQALDDIQRDAQRLSSANDFGDARHFIQKLQTFYADKPQAIFYQRCIDQLPDYSNDREIIEHIERVFVQPLDQEALRRVSSFSLQTGAAVAVSPWASLDMLLSLWRSLKMIDEVAQVYGIRPSLSNRYKLLKQVIHQLIFVGATDIMVDQLMSEFGAASLTTMTSTRIGQGVGAGIYTARIGIAAMMVSRPIEFNGSNKPKLKSVIMPMLSHIKNLFKSTK